MTLEQQATQTETYELGDNNGVPLVFATTAAGVGIPTDGEGLVGTAIANLANRNKLDLLTGLGRLKDLGLPVDSGALSVAVSIPTWRINDAANGRSRPQIEASYAARAIGQAKARDALVNRCLQPTGAPKLVLTGVLDDNTSYVRVFAVVYQQRDSAQTSGEAHLLTEGFVYAAHRALRVNGTFGQHPSRG